MRVIGRTMPRGTVSMEWLTENALSTWNLGLIIGL